MTAAEIKAAVQMSVNREDAHDLHSTYPVRRPVMCVVCETPGVRGAMCAGCREAWMERAA